MPDHNANTYKGLLALLSIAESDARLTCPHVSVMLALFSQWVSNGCTCPFPISRAKIMWPSKIKSIATYHKVIRELQQFGYITYEPSYHPGIGSMVHLRFTPL